MDQESEKELLIGTLVEKLDRERDRYGKMATTVAEYLARELTARTTPHIVTSRVKSAESLRAKLVRDWPKMNAQALMREFSPDVLDVCGVRVLLYREADVTPATELIEELFVVGDNKRLKKSFTESDGYRAEHRTVQLSPDMLAEESRLENLVGVLCEVQVATVIDHIWNELEHDIKYKTHEGKPTDAQRVALANLRSGLTHVGGMAQTLDAETQKRIGQNTAIVQGPEELRRVLELGAGRTLRGDFERLFKLLTTRQKQPLTRKRVEALPVDPASLAKASAEVSKLPGFSTPDDVEIFAAAWRTGRDFPALVGDWPGRPSRLAKLVRALSLGDGS